ncbi:hypothetical protein ABZP36_035193 [Zizania latifolia]
MTSTTTSSASSVSTGADTSSESNSAPPPQRLFDQGIATTTADNSGSSTGGGGPGPTTAEAQLPDAGRLPRVGVGGGGGQNQACAACKYQRRKCTPDCQLAPYFPADDQRRFLNAHHLFGVSNIKKTLNLTPPDRHQDAMRALTFEAEARAQDPVGGAAGIVVQLRHVYHAVLAELATVLHQLAFCRQQQQQAAAANHANDVLMADDDPAAMLLAGVGAGLNQYDPVVNNALYVDQQIAGEAAVVQAVGGALQEQYEAQVQPPPQNYFYHGTAGDEGSSHAWNNVDSVQDFGNGGEAEPPMGLCQIEATPFVEPIDVKPELPTTMGDNGSVGHVEQQDSKAPP